MALDSTILDSEIAGVQQYATQDPTGGDPGIPVPPAVLQMLMKTSAALQPKPSAAPPHPQITALTSAIAGGLQVSFNQLVSPTPYGNQITAYKIYRNTTANAFSGATLIRTVSHDNAANQKVVQVQDLLGSNKTASYFCTAVDSTGQESSIPGSFQSASVNSGTFNPNVAQALGGSGNTTASPTYSTVPGVTLTLTTKGNKVLSLATISFTFTAGGTASFAIFMDGSQISGDYVFTGAAAAQTCASLAFINSPPAGSHTFDLRWKSVTSTTITNVSTPGIEVVELG